MIRIEVFEYEKSQDLCFYRENWIFQKLENLEKFREFR
jgi:hypothetical protein